MIVLGVLYTCVVLWVTLRPIAWAADGAEESLGILSLGAWTDVSAWTEGRPLEVVLNVLMFLPVGVTAGLLHRGLAGMVGPVVLTLVIELAQIPLDRISHPRDLVANATGALIGIAVLTAYRHKHRRHTHPQERRQQTTRLGSLRAWESPLNVKSHENLVYRVNEQSSASS